MNHLKCAAFELPIAPEDHFGSVDVAELCERLAESGFLHRSGGNWHWVQEAYPADAVSLRSVTSDNFVIINTNGDENGEAWGGSTMSDRVARLDPRTGKFVEYLLPKTTNIRRVFIDESTNPVTFWCGNNMGAEIIKLEPLD